MKVSNALLEWALHHAELGWRVFPIIPGGKRPAIPDHTTTACDHSDPRCARGHQGWEPRATTDPQRIRRAWTHHRYNIGLACGPSGLVVIDCDTDPERGRPGSQALTELAAERGVQLPATFTVATPSGGQHLYFTTPPGVHLRNSRDTLGPNIDTRAHGGYVITAGSIRPDGTYELANDTEPTELPAWIVQALLQRPATDISAPAVRAPAHPDAYAVAALQGETERVRTAASGHHNTTLSTAAYRLGQLAAAGLLNPEQVRGELRTAAQTLTNADCSCTEREVERVITAGLTAGLRRPRGHQERPVA